MTTMNITNLVQSVPSLLALNTLTDASGRGVRKVGNTLRCKLLARKVDAASTPELNSAILTLVAEGRSVRLFQGKRIWSVQLVDGANVWSERASRSFRKHAVVEVAL